MSESEASRSSAGHTGLVRDPHHRTGFPDADWAEAISPLLSVVAQPVYELGAEAGRLLLDRVHGTDRRPVHRRLPTRFIERDSAESVGTGP
ncbi:substrate-binding domain-containing protein [Nonomuraea guangzhouensis]|uniref:Substrate-binding domain-containing protein n=1 Tax=Nonomuraea guangzhouensis TaxID=1291555 RepID=A0ABW4GZ01_9ACTN|nr:substrate-binding domain-containing protein [Nonomuraea guangzhouensis]